ncbi:MAG TPA: urea ABC transporter permease subunit UrtC [Candidatus Didemnitutus sp.]|nr:urea ABC transporter permease subunit UrtC [Candidatus Didemnitutus sp.]
MSPAVPGQSLFRSRHFEFTVVALFLVVLGGVLPVLNVQGLLSDYTITLWGKYLCYALLAISVDLLWGYTGLLSLGQALFFSLGGYMFGMYLMLLIGPLGSYAKAGQNPAGLPDFMVFLGHTFLPPFWRPFHSFGFAVLMVFAVPGLLALIFGFLAFRSRIKGVYFSILTQALTYGAALLFFRNDTTMGGNNGFTDFKFILSYSLVDKVTGPATMRGLFVASAAALLLVSLGCYWVNGTKFGLVRKAIRDSENRVLFSGYATADYKLFVFVAAAMIAGVGGALFVPQAGIINPDQMTPEKSIEPVVWVAVGGRGTLIGPIIGAIGVNALRSWATHAYPDSWLIILGGLFIVVVLFLPGGIVSIPGRLAALRRKTGAAEPEPETVAPAAIKS